MKSKKLIANLTALATVLSMSASLSGVSAYAADPADTSKDTYVLMNIPYDEFYKADIVNDVDVDIVTSATKAKTKTGTLVAGSFHESTEGTDITGVTYPVKVSDLSELSGYKQVNDSDTLSITVTNRGKTVTTDYTGKETLFENNKYSYYVLSGDEAPDNYKELTFDSEGKPSFSEIKGKSIQSLSDATATITASSKYGDYQVSLNNLPFSSDTIYGVILKTEDGKSYGLRHLENVWRVSELAWCTGNTKVVHGSPTSSDHYKAMVGHTIKTIEYITSSGVYDINTSLDVPEYKYALMNIPYDDFYKAEITNDVKVDGVTSATLQKTRNSGLSAGSFHEDSNGSDITGVTYPVKVETSKLGSFKQVKDSDTLSITVSGKKGETTTEYVGKDTLFENNRYSYYILPEGEIPAYYKEVSFDENGNPAFSAIKGNRAQEVSDATAEITDESKYGDYQIVLDNVPFAEDTIYGVILKTEDGNSYGLRHLENIWKVVKLAWCTGNTTVVHGCPTSSDHYKAMVGHTITGIEYITSSGVYKITTELNVAKVDTSKLEEAVKNAEALNEADFTAESWAQFQTALQAAKDMLASPKGQNSVDTAENNLNTAVTALVKIVTIDNVAGLNVSATTANAIKLNWSKVDNAEGYIVYRYDAANKTWTTVAKTAVNSYTFTKLNAGTSYRFAVKAYATDNDKEILSLSFTQVVASTNPAVVTGLKAAATTANAIKLQWNKVSGAQGYIIYRYDAAKKTWVRVAKTTTTANAYVATKLNAGTTYKFAVKAYRTVSGKELSSISFPQLTTSTNPAAVKFTVTAGVKKAVVKWSKTKGATGYVVYYKTSAKGAWQKLKVTSETSFTKTGLVKGKTYYFTVRAYRTVAGRNYYGTFAAKSVKVK